MTTRELESTKMEAKESFANFVKRWRAKAVLMIEHPNEKDQLRIISRNLQPDYARHLVLAQASANFETFFDSGLAIEDALQSGILSKGEPSNPPKAKPRAYSGNTNALFGGGTYSNTATTGTNATSSNIANHISDVNQNGAFVLGASISDLFHQSIPAVQLNSASSLDSPYFNVTNPSPSPSLTDRFLANPPPPKADMQAIVCDADHDPCSYITNEEFPHPEVPYPSNRDCNIMVKDLVPPANLWDVDEVVDIQAGTEVWAVNRSLVEGIRSLKEDGTPVLGILHGEEDVDLGGFSFDTFGSVLAIIVDGNFILSSVAMDIMRRMSFFPGLGLGIRQ
ncbi:hypothetical protein RHMOL_Rhmol02G0240100 [Rhododendron molle]|uniref:Uncharacterized protein n=1 Tax=Rhododendron molle TaxID=49168 RepID=A0ACC0PTM2_RHOML|nr:hypothetical protein RHMOL_Rhmol02G0240100 [Rhododendron molle]